MKIQFWRPNPDAKYTAPTWLVVIEDSVFEMSENAMDANGVNLHAGQESELDRSWLSGTFDCIDYINHVPCGIIKATLQRIADLY